MERLADRGQFDSPRRYRSAIYLGHGLRLLSIPGTPPPSRFVSFVPILPFACDNGSVIREDTTKATGDVLAGCGKTLGPSLIPSQKPHLGDFRRFRTFGRHHTLCKQAAQTPYDASRREHKYSSLDGGGFLRQNQV